MSQSPQPAPELRDPSQDARIRFVRQATIICFVLGFSFGVVIIPLLVAPSAPHTTAIFAAVVCGSTSCALGYLAVRRGRERAAAWGVIAAGVLGPLIASPSSPMILAFMPSAVAMASLVLSARSTGLVGAVAAAAPLAAVLWVPALDLVSAGVLASANLTMSALLLVTRGWNRRLISDMLQQREAEHALNVQLREARRLEGIGRLAGGVAHDLNNLLTVIIGNLDLMDPDLDEGLPDVHAASLRAAALVRQLLIYARRQPRQLEVLDLAEVTRAIQPLLLQLPRENTTLQLDVAAPAFVRMDRTQLEQVLLNLVGNACQATQARGGLVSVTVQPEPSAGTVLLVVSDDGQGMPPEIQQQVFEPFFTTRQGEGGTGLGLATVHAIIQQSGGQIFVESTLGRGTTFSVRLPAQPAPASAAAPERAPAEPAASGTILVVDDDDAVRRTLARLLEERGHTLLVADGAREALDLAMTQEPDLLVTDVVMPRVSGRELAVRLRERYPGLPVLFVSGYIADVDIPPEQLLPKPVDAGMLHARVDRLLRQARERQSAG